MRKSLIAVVLISTGMYAQVGINTTTPNASLEIKSSNQVTPANNDGIIIPKVDTFPVTNPSALQQGMMVYLTTTSSGKLPGFYYWDNTTTSWIDLAGGKGWGLTGNTGINPAIHFIGTINNADVVFQRSTTRAGFLGISNTSLGVNALNPENTGLNNTAVGTFGLYSNTTGIYNTATGASALSNNTTGNRNTATGYVALRNNTIGNYNTANGGYALYANTTGNNNTANGYQTLYFNTTGNSNSASGSYALWSTTTGNNNTANGYEALRANTTGNNNTASGYQAMRSNTTGFYNTAVGYQALYNNTGPYYIGSLYSDGGSYNTAIGYNALFSNTVGMGNIAIGYRSLYNNIGFNNIAIGADALYHNDGAYSNVATGNRALYNNKGRENTAIGHAALDNNTIGIYNTAVGHLALRSNNMGNYNTALGHSAYYPVGHNLTNYTAIGYNTGSSASASNMVEIGNTSVITIRGQVNFSTYSDRRIKKNIQNNVPGLRFITQLRPVTYNVDIHQQNEIIYRNKKEANTEWEGKYDIEKITQTGFIAQEVATSAKEIGFDFNGIDHPTSENDLYGLRYAEFVVPLVKAVQEQQEIIENQFGIINDLEKRIKILEEKFK